MRRSRFAMTKSCSDSGRVRSDATLQKHRSKLIGGLEQSHSWIAVPEAQSLDLVIRFNVRHTDLEYSKPAARECNRRYPRTGHAFVDEGGTHFQRPSTLQVPYSAG